MTKDNNLNDIGNKEILRMLGIVALPIALQSLIGSSLNLIDNLMVGSLGELQLNAVGVSVQIFFIYWMLLYGFSGGAATFISQFFGVKDYVNIKRTTGFAISVALCVGLLFFVVAELFPRQILGIFTKYPDVIDVGVGYIRLCAPSFLMVAVTQPFTIALRATQQTRLPLYASALALAMNTLLNYVLIFGKFGAPAMGVNGAALATAISRALEMGFILFVVFGRKNIVAGKMKEFFGFGKALAGKIVKNALPTTANETLWGLGTSLYVAAFARIGITEGAAIQACSTINNLFTLAAFSMGDAILILVGQKLGEGKPELAYNMSKKLLKIGFVVGAVMGLGIILAGEPILSLFDFSEKGADYAGKILLVYGLTMWISLYNAMQITGTLRCGGDTKYAMIAETAAVWLIGVPMAFFTSLYLGWPIYFAVLAVKLEEVVKAVLLTRRYFSKKWVKNVINNLV